MASFVIYLAGALVVILAPRQLCMSPALRRYSVRPQSLSRRAGISQAIEYSLCPRPEAARGTHLELGQSNSTRSPAPESDRWCRIR